MKYKPAEKRTKSRRGEKTDHTTALGMYTGVWDSPNAEKFVYKHRKKSKVEKKKKMYSQLVGTVTEKSNSLEQIKTFRE